MDAEVGVVGIGSMGSMAMWQLARRGVSVIGFEQFGIGHDRGAAGGDTRIFRTSYKEGPDYVPILLEAYKEWRQLEKETGQDLLTITEGLMIDDQDSEAMKNVLQSIEDYQLEHRILSKEEAEKEFPQHRLASNEKVVVDKQAGFVRSQLAILAAATRAEALGAVVHSHSPVEKIEEKPDGNGVTIVANGKEYTVGSVIITVGPWINEVYPAFRHNIEVRRLIGTWFPAKQMAPFSPDQFPVFTRKSGEISYYGIPSIDGTMVKVSFSPKKINVEKTAELNKKVTTEELDIGRHIVKHNFRGLYSEPNRINTYMEGYTSDGHPIIGKIPGKERIIISGGFSGHGFKMASAIGKILADIAMDIEPLFNMEKFNPSRFLRLVEK